MQGGLTRIVHQNDLITLYLKKECKNSGFFGVYMTNIICTDISGLTETQYRALYETASTQRRKRADRYRHREDALRCLVSEALLRLVLGTADFTEEKAAAGKPYIRNRPDFHYNLSHSGCWVVLASGDREVGVDVERIRPETDTEAISNRFFSIPEQQYVQMDPVQSRHRFFEIWTAKESYIKYLGTGLKTDLTAFNVLSLRPGLHLHQRKLGDGYCLSLCTEDPDYDLKTVDVQKLLP